MNTVTLYVPELPLLYEQVRDTAVDPLHPLSESEVRRFAAPFDRQCKALGIRQFTVEETLHLMERWAENNVRRMDDQRRARDRQARLERGAHQHGSHPHDRSDMNALFSQVKTSNGPRPQYRHRNKKSQGKGGR